MSYTCKVRLVQLSPHVQSLESVWFSVVLEWSHLFPPGMYDRLVVNLVFFLRIVILTFDCAANFLSALRLESASFWKECVNTNRMLLRTAS